MKAHSSPPLWHRPARSLALIGALALALGVSACHTTQLSAQQRRLSFSSEQLTRHLQRTLPSEQCLFGKLACMHLQNPQVSMKADDQRLFIRFDARFSVQGEDLGQGAATVAGVPRYEAAKGAFFVNRPELLKLELPGIPAYQSSIAAQLVSELLAEEISQQPVWTLDESDPQQALARLTLRGVHVENGRLVLTMGDEEVPLEDPTQPEPAAGPKAGPAQPFSWPPRTTRL
ncbi:MAG: DUF1439 domain-containing protein [Lautropia sp.]|nr:DUF1439 domain-containing protein [Lautropia sp.]